MPFSSRKQERFMFSQHPDIAKRWVADAKAAREPTIRAADMDLTHLARARYADGDLGGQTPSDPRFWSNPQVLAVTRRMPPYIVVGGKPMVLSPEGYLPAPRQPTKPAGVAMTDLVMPARTGNAPSPPVPAAPPPPPSMLEDAYRALRRQVATPPPVQAQGPLVNPSAGDLDLYRKRVADAYREMTKPAATQYHDAPGSVDLASPTVQKYVASGWLPPNPTTDQVQTLGDLFASKGAISYQQKLAGELPPDPNDPSLSGIHPPAWSNAKLDQTAQQAAAIGVPSTGTQAQVSAQVAPLTQEMTRAGFNQRAEDAARAADDAARKKPVAASKVDIAGVQATGATPPQGAAPYDISLVPHGRLVTRPAVETPNVDPARIAQLSSDQQAIIGDNADVGYAEAHAAEDAGVAAALKGQALKGQQADIQAKAAERNAYLEQQESKIRDLSAEVANTHEDPDRWWRNKSTFSKIALGLAAALREAVSIRTGTANTVMQQIQGHIDADIAAQRQDIERKKGQIGDMQGLLASAYRRFGNLDQAENAARAVALQQLDAEQQAYAARTGSEVAMAKSRLLSAQMQFEADKYKAGLYQYHPAATGMAGGPDPKLVKQANDLAADLVKKGDDPTQARRRAYAAVGLISSNVGGFVETKPGQSPDDRFQKYKDDLLAKGQIPLSRAEWDKAQSADTPTGPGANVPKPEGVAYDPRRWFQGTDAYKKELAQGNYNAAIYRAVFQRYPVGIDRSEAAQKAILDKFLVHPGDLQDTIDAKVAAAHSQLGLNVGGSAGGVAVTPEEP